MKPELTGTDLRDDLLASNDNFPFDLPGVDDFPPHVDQGNDENTPPELPDNANPPDNGDDIVDLFGGEEGGQLLDQITPDLPFENDDDGTFIGGRSKDVLEGGGGEDILKGRGGSDDLTGGDGNDILKGGRGKDTLDGGDGNDQLFGGNGKDYLDGGAGADELFGGRGKDIFIFDAEDTIIDGGKGKDTLLFDGADETLDLTGDGSPDISSVEVIDLTGSGDNTLILDAQDVLILSDKTDVFVDDGTHQLLINGDAGDTVISTEQGWVQGDDVQIGDDFYSSYTHVDTGTQLFVDTDISQDIF